jgi:D-glycero-D-manno-heptose 1,7-bisphosphate phosphatase
MMGALRMRRPAVFLDKDGTLIHDVPYNVDPARVQLTLGAREGVRVLRAAGYALVVASNQSGVARGLFTPDDLVRVRARIEQLLELTLDGFYCCPHLPDGLVDAYAIDCECRKPRPGLLTRAAQELGLDLERSWMVGDILSDVEAGARAGCRTVLLMCGFRTETFDGPLRTPTLIATDLHDAARRITSPSL